MATQSLLDGFGHDARIVSGILGIVAAKHHWVAGIVHEHRKRPPVCRIHAQHRDGRVHRSGRNLGGVAFKPSDGAVRVRPMPIVADVGNAVADSEPSLAGVLVSVGNGLRDLIQNSQLPSRNAIAVGVLDNRTGVGVRGGREQVGNSAGLAHRRAQSLE